MEFVQVRMQVSKVTSANVSYLSKRLGLPKPATYALIVDLFVFERDLDVAFTNLNNYLFTVGTQKVHDEKQPLEDQE